MSAESRVNNSTFFITTLHTDESRCVSTHVITIQPWHLSWVEVNAPQILTVCINALLRKLPACFIDASSLCCHSDSHMARRESTRRGFRDCQRSESPTNTISSYTPISPQPRAARRNRAPIRFNSPSYTNSPVLPFFSAQTNTSFGDIFTAVLGSKLAKQSTSKNLHSQMEPLLLSEPMKSNNVVKKAPITQTFLEPLAFECRVREDRERQLDIRCLRIIRKLNCYPEYQEIVRRFANVESEMDAEALMTSCVNKARLRSSCGVRAYLRKFLRLKEPTHPLTVSQATLLLSSDSTPEHSCVREVNGSPNRYDARRLSRNSMILEQSSEMEETWAMERSVNMTNGSSGSGTVVVAAAPRNLPPETLLRRLARSISIRLAYKRCLLEQANQRLTELDKVTNVIRSILRKATDEALPQMRNGTEVCYFNIPPIAPPVAEVVEMKLCQVTSDHPLLRSFPLPSTLSIPALVSNSAETALPEVTANLLPRFDRLLSSQTAVLELLCQLTRRLYCLDRRIAERIATGADTTTRLGDEQQPCELDAILFPLQSRRQQLVEQIAEAQRLRDDFEGTKVRLLSGLQHQFFVLHDTFIHSEGTKSGENSASLSEGHECFNSSGRSSPSTPPRSEVDNVICLAEYVSQHLGTYLQALLIKLLLETEIYDDQEAVDCVGEHLRLVASFSP
uniref:Uncharacterized protein n=1 Tax=Echinococcus granulosus TaxID=6210 RepID=A0A068WJF5_ECHGR|nr:hypothetical protein EgrG_001056500 [Echinococcus granulosus]